MFSCFKCFDSKGEIFNKPEDLEKHLLTDHLHNPTYVCQCNDVFSTQCNLVAHYHKVHGITEIQIKCTFKPGDIEERRKVWEYLIDSTLKSELKNYALPGLIASCNECHTIVNRPDTPHDIIKRLEGHLWQNHFNRNNYVCNNCSIDDRPIYPTERMLLKHYDEKHEDIIFTIVYTLDSDLIEKQHKVLKLLIEVRRFLESRKTNSEQHSNTATVSNVSLVPSETDNGDVEIICVGNKGTTENNVEQKPRRKIIRAIESDIETGHFSATKIFGRSQSMPPMTPNKSQSAPEHNQNNGAPNEVFNAVVMEEGEFASTSNENTIGNDNVPRHSIENSLVGESDMMRDDYIRHKFAQIAQMPLNPALEPNPHSDSHDLSPNWSTTCCGEMPMGLDYQMSFLPSQIVTENPLNGHNGHQLHNELSVIQHQNQHNYQLGAPQPQPTPPGIQPNHQQLKQLLAHSSKGAFATKTQKIIPLFENSSNGHNGQQFHNESSVTQQQDHNNNIQASHNESFTIQSEDQHNCQLPAQQIQITPSGIQPSLQLSQQLLPHFSKDTLATETQKRIASQIYYQDQLANQQIQRTHSVIQPSHQQSLQFLPHFASLNATAADQNLQHASQLPARQIQSTPSGMQSSHKQSQQFLPHSATSNAIAADQNVQLHSANSTPNGTNDCGLVIANDVNMNHEHYKKRKLSNFPGTSKEIYLGPSVNDCFQHRHVNQMDGIEASSQNNSNVPGIRNYADINREWIHSSAMIDDHQRNSSKIMDSVFNFVSQKPTHIITSYKQFAKMIHTDEAAIEYLQDTYSISTEACLGVLGTPNNCNFEKSPRVILGILYCWSHKMSEEEIKTAVGKIIGTEVSSGLVKSVCSSVQKACYWHVYNRNPPWEIGGPDKTVEVDTHKFEKLEPIKDEWVLGVVCRETGKKWMDVILDCKNSNERQRALNPQIIKNVHEGSNIIASNTRCTYLKKKRHFRACLPTIRRDGKADPANPQAHHFQAVNLVWDRLNDFLLPNTEISPKSLPLYLAEWLWRDEISRKKPANPFDEILKTFAQMWPATAKNENNLAVRKTDGKLDAIDNNFEVSKSGEVVREHGEEMDGKK